MSVQLLNEISCRLNTSDVACCAHATHGCDDVHRGGTGDEDQPRPSLQTSYIVTLPRHKCASGHLVGTWPLHSLPQCWHGPWAMSAPPPREEVGACHGQRPDTFDRQASWGQERIHQAVNILPGNQDPKISDGIALLRKVII